MRLFLGAYWPYILAYMLCLSIAAFAMMGLDKRRAKRGQWRIRESSFFLIALLGGAAGAVAGMHAFHHKTRHWYFRMGLPALLVVQIALTLWVALDQGRI